MKFRYFSDIHLEFTNSSTPVLDEEKPVIYPMETDNETVLILAGDIGVGTGHHGWLREQCKLFKAVVYVCGNHEFYHHQIQFVKDKLKELDEELDNFHFLDGGTIEIENTVITGGTLWTPMAGDHYLLRYYINDFRLIKNGNRALTPADAADMNDEYIQQLKKVVEGNKDKNVVVVTHHPPTKLMADPWFEGNPAQPAYENYLETFIEENPQIKYWIFGHTHQVGEVMCGKTKIITNAVGYTMQNTGYDKEALVEV